MVGIVRSHRGLLDVESEPGVGTTMVVYLPVTDRPAQARKSASTAQPRSLEGVTILLVDDELAVRRVTRAMLERGGCKVIEAANGREGVDAYRAHGSTVGAVLMDVSMPVMNGEAALRELLTINPDVKVILTSGYTEVDTAKGLAGLGAGALLQKPYRYQELLEALGALVR